MVGTGEEHAAGVPGTPQNAAQLGVGGVGPRGLSSVLFSRGYRWVSGSAPSPVRSWLWGDHTAPVPCSRRLVLGCWQVSVSGFISCHLKWPQMPVLCTEMYLQCRAVRDSVTKRKLL